MFAKYSKIVQLLLSLCIILHNCGSAPHVPRILVVKSPDEITNHRRCIWPFSYFSTPNDDDAKNCDEKTDLPENLNLSKHLSDKIESTPLRISLFPTKDSDERKDKEIITDNVQQETTNQTDISSEAQIAHKIKESNQSFDQIFLPDIEDHKSNHRVQRTTSHQCNGTVPLPFNLGCADPTLYAYMLSRSLYFVG